MRRWLAGLAAAGLLVATGHAENVPGPSISVVYGTEPGERALDADSHGGNPFATALIEALAGPPDAISATLDRVTIKQSDELQFPDLSDARDLSRVALENSESGAALVVVFADYGDAQGMPSLPGAAFDADRVARAFQRAGYKVTVHVASDAKTYKTAISDFADRAATADAAVVYTTGHGMEVSEGSSIFLIPPDAQRPPFKLEGFISLTSVSRAVRGADRGFVFYAGCRDNPLKL